MKRIILSAVLIFIAGCETLAPRVEGPADAQAWEARRERLQALERWRFEGRVAIAVEDEGWNAHIDWEQSGEHLDVNFSGPLGVGSARVAGTPARLEVHSTEGEHFITTDPATDLYWHLGWTAPVDLMRYWVLGLPGPSGNPELEIDGAGRLARLQQGGWDVEYVDYLLQDELPADGAMPRRIDMRRDDVRIRVVVSDWVLPDSPK